MHALFFIRFNCLFRYQNIVRNSQTHFIQHTADECAIQLEFQRIIRVGRLQFTQHIEWRIYIQLCAYWKWLHECGWLSAFPFVWCFNTNDLHGASLFWTIKMLPIHVEYLYNFSFACSLFMSVCLVFSVLRRCAFCVLFFLVGSLGVG